jgi:hypothetical protein
MGVYTDPDGWVIDSDTGTATRGAETRPLTDEEQYLGEELDTAKVVEADYLAGIAVLDAARASLTAALDLMAAGPLDDAGRGQVDAALTQYRALPPTPPADVVDLANRVSTHIQSNGYLKAQEARAAHMTAEQQFVSDPTISHAQLVAHVRELTRRIWELRGGA